MKDMSKTRIEGSHLALNRWIEQRQADCDFLIVTEQLNCSTQFVQVVIW